MSWDQSDFFLALNHVEDVFDLMEEELPSPNYFDVYLEIERGKSQSEIADSIGVDQSTVSRGVDNLLEIEMIRECEEGWEKTFSIFNHPLIKLRFQELIKNA